MPNDFVVFLNGCRGGKKKTLFYAALDKLLLAKPYLIVYLLIICGFVPLDTAHPSWRQRFGADGVIGGFWENREFFKRRLI